MLETVWIILPNLENKYIYNLAIIWSRNKKSCIYRNPKQLSLSTDLYYHFMQTSKCQPHNTSAEISLSLISQEHHQPKEIKKTSSINFGQDYPPPVTFQPMNSQPQNLQWGTQSLKPFSRRETLFKIQETLTKSWTLTGEHSTSTYPQENYKQYLPLYSANNKEEQIFHCNHMSQQQQSVCQFCKGEGYLVEKDNMVKFFKYLVGYKLGKKPCYSAYIQKTHKTQVNSAYSYNHIQRESAAPKKITNKNFTYRLKQRKSQRPTLKGDRFVNIKKINESTEIRFTRSSTKSSVYSREQVIEELSNAIVVHQNYICDECNSYPIIGPRFHCITCEDFDLCQNCNNEHPHVHMMQKISKSGKTKQLEKLLRFFNSSGRMNSTVKAPPMKQYPPNEYQKVLKTIIA